MVATPLAVSLPRDMWSVPLSWWLLIGSRGVRGNAGDVMWPPRGQPSTVTVSCPPRAMTLGVATMLLGPGLGLGWKPSRAAAVGAASPRVARAVAETARARVVRM